MALIEQMGAMGPAGEEDPRRRRSRGLGGYEGIGGANIGIEQMLPWLHGLGGYDYSGPGRGQLGGLMDMLGPSARHFGRQGLGPQEGFEGPPGATQLPGFQGQGPEGQGAPGLDNRNPLAGTNIAPGNIDTGMAINQPMGRGRFGQMPQTQGWRNVAPGYSAAAGLGYGTPEFEQRLRGIGATPGGQGFGGGRGIAGGQGLVTPGTTGGGATTGGGGGQGARPGGGATPAPQGGGARPSGGRPTPRPGGGPGPSEAEKAGRARREAPGGGGTTGGTGRGVSTGGSTRGGRNAPPRPHAGGGGRPSGQGTQAGDTRGGRGSEGPKPPKHKPAQGNEQGTQAGETRGGRGSRPTPPPPPPPKPKPVGKVKPRSNTRGGRDTGQI